MPIAPTLILGLGGTGSKIVEKVSQKVKETESGNSERIAFVVFDTDINDLGRIKRESPEIFTVQTSTRNTVGEYLGINTNARDNWFPVNEMMNRKTLTEGAAQVRAISRLAFDTTLKGGNLSPLHQAVEQLFRIDKDQEEQALRVIITSSLAGGTGSGILLSVAMYLANFLKAKYPKAKAITRGFFVQPDVCYSVIPGAEEQQNLQVNAYAAVRELDAFLMKNDNTLAPQYKHLKFEFPRIGSDGVEEVHGMPYDFCFLFDANNKEGGSLDNFASYLDHAATCIYTQSIGPMSKKSNSREDNVLREVIKNDGRNRYAGAGASRLVYPWQHVRDVVGLQWANEALSKQWLQFDDQYKQRLEGLKKQRESGYAARDIDRAAEFIAAVDAAAANREPFAKAVQSQCLVYDADGLSVDAKQWEVYVERLSEHIGRSVDQISDDAERSQLSMTVAALAENTDPAAYSDAFHSLRRHMRLEVRRAEEHAGVLGYSLFKADNESVTKDGHPHQLETYLREKVSTKFVHPVAARYFLYQTEKALEAELREVQQDLEKSREYFDNFEDRNFDDPETDEIETADSYAMRKKTFGERLTRKPSGDKQALAENLLKYLPNIRNYVEQIMLEAVLADAIEYTHGLATAFERFFISLEGNLKRLRTRVEQERTKFDELKGSTTRYVLANSECIDSLSQSMPYMGGVTTIDSALAEKIYTRVREYHMLTDEKDEGFFKDLYNNTILGYFADEVMESYGSQIKMDVIEALEREHRILKRSFEEEEARHYVRDEIAKAKRLAAPFIEQPLGEERHPIEACAYNPAIEGDSAPKRKSMIGEILGNYGGEKDEALSPHEILFYNAIYSIRARDLSKFAPARVDDTESRAAGEYFTAYYNLVSGIKPSVGETKVISPHIDRRWHSISELPDLDEENQALQLRTIHRALLLGLAYKRIEWTPTSNGSNVYRFKSETGRLDDFVVSNGTPCDQFYEVVDALTINPVAVQEILNAVEHAATKERERMRGESFDSTRLGSALTGGLRLDQLSDEAENFRAATYSIFDLAAYHAYSTPNEDYVEELLYAMVDDFIACLSEEVETVIGAEEASLKVQGLLQEQLAMFEQNLHNYVEISGKAFVHKLRVILRPLQNLAEQQDYEGLHRRTEAIDDRLRELAQR
ncbi:MAG: hypothetical protein GX862_04025 [Leucobacter sp.]|nr:hypothetical protein [Leucobacter sp.]